MAKRLLIKSIGLVLLGLSLAVVLTPSAFAASPKTITSPKVIGCGSATYVYDHVSYKGLPLLQFGPTYRDYNGGTATAEMTLTATVGGTATLTVSTSVKVDASVILAGAEATVGTSLSYSVTANVSNQFKIYVPAHKAGYGAYGVFRVETTGHYYYRLSDCSVGTDYGTITAYSPDYVGWNTWIGN